MAVRIMTYVGLLYQYLIESKQLAAKGKLPPVLPIVLRQKNCTAAFVAAIKNGDAAPIPFEELMEISRVTVELASS
ncbi:MAG: hypothetical protein U9P37_02620 [Pseudomonadota bacterium]|nr:hypothetical protein [Pseudomonadota bacterium]